MKKIVRYIVSVFIAAFFVSVIWQTNASVKISDSEKAFTFMIDTPPVNPDSLKYPFKDSDGYPFSTSGVHQSPLYLGYPSNIKREVYYDEKTGNYVFQEKIGDLDYRRPTTMTLDEYREYDFNKAVRDYWRQRARGESFEHHGGLIPQLHVGGEVFDMIFGSNAIDIKPQGSAELIFGLNISKTDNPTLPVKLRRTTTFDFQEKIQMNVTGQIGDKLKLATNYNTEATFDFENKMNIGYEGKEDEIIQKIEAGDVTLPLTGSLITGSQSLFGIKTELKFGKLTVTSVFSQQKGKTSVIDVQGGAQTSEFEIYADQYEANKHFFLSQYFYDTYDEALKNLPVINTGINITKIEVWVTNKTSATDNTRNIVAFMDLGEKNPFSGQVNYYNQSDNPRNYPNNEINSLNDYFSEDQVRYIDQVSNYLQSEGLRNGVDFEKIESARLLSPSEYTLNSKLGYISLNSSLNADEVLGVAFEYTVGGKTYRVGEFSNGGVDAPKALIVKLIKGTSLTPKYPNWNLMMKNIYAIGAYQIDPSEFYLDVMYRNDKTGTSVNYIPAGDIDGKILLKVLNLDNLNSQLDPTPDGVFDFIEGVTINSTNGRVIFPVREPFGEYLRKKINNDQIAEQYVYEELYDSTQSKAQQIAEKNKFFISGTYKSASGSDISLNAMNIPQGSVTVTAGGIKLTENVDYTVDYTLGRVKIINQGLLESGTPIRISLESNALFSIQSKTLLGSHFDYQFSDKFNVGATILNLTERPLTQKVNIGDEPISNTIWGINTNYRTEAPLLTKLVDKLPFIETKEASSIVFEGEFAHLIPGHSKAVEKEGVSYIDDFEGSETSIDIKSMAAWVHASTPQKQPNLFPETSITPGNDTTLARAYNFNRAKLAWYVIDPLFLRNVSTTPEHLKNTPEQSNHFVREIFEQEIFPYKESPQNVPTNIAVLNLAFYPNEKGPYNYDVAPFYATGKRLSAGINSDGLLNDPASRWGGIMREIQSSDFEAANVEYIEFWLMDPFVYDQDSVMTGGDLYFNLGDISEDILKDSRKSFENGLPTSDTDTLFDETVWGRVPVTQSVVNAFDNDEASRENQDVGLDGLKDVDEQSFFSEYINEIESVYGATSQAYLNAVADPSSDDYHYFRGSDYDDQELTILDRYKKYNGLESNSPTSGQSPETYPTAATTLPNTEDVNRDNTLSEAENYYQYKVSIRPEDMEVGKNYITDMIEGETDDDGIPVKWYQFKIPVKNPESVVGDISDFKSIRFIRMFLKNFDTTVVLRFATLDLVRSEWRKYLKSFKEGGLYVVPDDSMTTFEISAVNIEENGYKSPINYILPPGISRVIDPANPQLRQLNEQSMVLKVCNLNDGDARAAYKNIDMDVRQYKRLKMFVHCEAVDEGMLQDNELSLFVRLGSDYQNNYYEYEVPLTLTPPGTYTQNENLQHQDRYIVWPEDNNVDIDFEVLTDLKQDRNAKARTAGSGVHYDQPYSKFDGHNYITIVGNPNLSNVRTIMVGVRNRRKENNPFIGDYDDGLPKCAEIWINELRLTDFDEKGGWAANARLTARLADFGTVTLAGSTSKPGFGSIEKKVNERSKEDVYRYDIASNLELGKFFPEKAMVRIPMYIGYSESIINPEYNPLDPDIPLKVTMKDDNLSEGYKDTVKYWARDWTQRKSLNFTNVKIGKSEGKPKLYDVSNFAVSYSYSETNSRNINTEYDNKKIYRGALTYNYNASPKNITPLKSVKFFRKPALRLIGDFNFYLLPNQISFMTDLNRMYSEKKLRNLDKPDILIEPTYDKDFVWNRIYDFRYNLTKSIKFDFSANNIARIDEPIKDGIYYVNKDSTDTYEHWKDSVWAGIKDLGRTISYHHDYNLNYSLPINKIPLFNWINASIRYSGTYDWITGPQIDTLELGNTIKNSGNAQFNGQLNLINLYNKIGYLKKINQKFIGGRGGRKQKPKTEKVQYPKKGDPPKIIQLKEDQPKNIIHNLETDNIQVKVFDKNGQEIKVDVKILTDNKIRITADDDYEDARIEITGEREIKETLFQKIVERTLYVMMGVKNISGTYNQTDGTYIPGYLPKTEILGMEDYHGVFAPGLQFIAGIRDPNFAERAADMGWITTDEVQNNAVMTTHTDNLTLRTQIEPIKGFRIDVNASRMFAKNITEYWVADSLGHFPKDPNDRSRMITGSFNISYFSWNTAFIPRGKKGDYSSKVFDNFLNYRITIANRLAINREQKQMGTAPYDYSAGVVDEEGFPDGYSSTSQDVLIPAFLAAYAGQDANKVTLETFPKIPYPNWRITYNGLTKIKFVKRYIKTASLNHSYRSSYSINSYTTNLYYDADEDDLNWVRETLQSYQDSSDFISEFEINGVSINEQLSPLIGLDLTWNNSLITKIEIKKTRNVNLNFSNNQITEVTGDEFVIGSGYRFDKVRFNLESLTGQKTQFESDLNVRLDLSIRKNLTVIRKIVENYWDITAGQNIITLKLSADYVLSDRFNIRLFFDKIVNRPKISSTFPTSNTNFGVSVRFTLAG